MIPKIIHYIWLGPAPLPPEQVTIIENWKKIMPDYQYICWGNEVLDDIDSIFVKDACSVQKWAFASDVIRLWVLLKYGGIYLDTDVIVKQPFDSLLEKSAFIGRENFLQIRGRHNMIFPPIVLAQNQAILLFVLAWIIITKGLLFCRIRPFYLPN